MCSERTQSFQQFLLPQANSTVMPCSETHPAPQRSPHFIT